jgi:hypothetical protein
LTHVSVADPQLPESLHCTQVSFSPSPEVSQNGVGAVHAPVFPVAHWTQVSVDASHAGVGAVHAPALPGVHCTQVPEK